MKTREDQRHEQAVVVKEGLAKLSENVPKMIVGQRGLAKRRRTQ
jgi:hypothetical protein